jgi:hypothetical protein
MDITGPEKLKAREASEAAALVDLYYTSVYCFLITLYVAMS